MPPFAPIPRLLPLAHRAIAVFTLACFLLASQGWAPSPSWMLARFRPREAYPCQDDGCGCTNARDCWTDCCCHSRQELLAWAIRHRVTPPPGLFSAQELTQAREASRHSPPACSACGKAARMAAARTPPPLVPSASALRCKGVSFLIAFAPVMAGGDLVGHLLAALPRVGYVMPNVALHPASRGLDAAEPPPRGIPVRV